MKNKERCLFSNKLLFISPPTCQHRQLWEDTLHSCAVSLSITLLGWSVSHWLGQWCGPSAQPWSTSNSKRDTSLGFIPRSICLIMFSKKKGELMYWPVPALHFCKDLAKCILRNVIPSDIDNMLLFVLIRIFGKANKSPLKTGSNVICWQSVLDEGHSWCLMEILTARWIEIQLRENVDTVFSLCSFYTR